MKHILAPIFLMVFLFPSLALGEKMGDLVVKGKGFLCETIGLGCTASVDMKDLVEREGLYYKKFSDVPFTGKTTGETQGSYKNGKKDGPFVSYHENGKLQSKGTYKNGERDGLWVRYHDNGKLSSQGTHKNGKYDGPWVSYFPSGKLLSKGTYKNGVKVK